jgi:pimeloyl-ACP methyl ester carboxylesterase
MTRLVEVGPCQLACSVTGTGPALLLMHGAEGDHRMFSALVPHLAPHFTVIAYDQRDCGETLNPEAPATLADLADDAAGLLEALAHRQAVVYGSSFGGRVAQALAHRHPHAVRALVLGSTWALPESLAELNGDTLRAIHALRASLPETAGQLAEYFLPADFLDANPTLKDIFRDVRPQSARSVRRQQAVGEQPALAPQDLRVPTLVISGEADRVVPPAATMALARAIPGAHAVLLPGVGHAAALQVPGQIAAHIRDFCANAIPNLAKADHACS